MAVRTTSRLRRGLERERRTGMRRRIEEGGAAEAEFVRVVEEFCGRTRSACAAAWRAAFRLR